DVPETGRKSAVIPAPRFDSLKTRNRQSAPEKPFTENFSEESVTSSGEDEKKDLSLSDRGRPKKRKSLCLLIFISASFSLVIGASAWPRPSSKSLKAFTASRGLPSRSTAVRLFDPLTLFTVHGTSSGSRSRKVFTSGSAISFWGGGEPPLPDCALAESPRAVGAAE